MHVEDRLAELEAKATPGPWNTDKARGDDYPIVWAESALVAQTFGGCEDCASPEEARANADLVAASRNAATAMNAVVRAARELMSAQKSARKTGFGTLAKNVAVDTAENRLRIALATLDRVEV